jgi:hypothetical protein
MSVLMHDARQKLNDDFGIRFPLDKISDLLYADDTLLVGGEAHVLQKYMDCIIGLGLEYGLELNWSKVEMMKVGVQADVLKPDGAPVTVKEALVYLGRSCTALAGLTQSPAAVWAPQRQTSTSFKKFGDTQICRSERGIRFMYLVSSAVSFTDCRQCGY